MGYTIDDELTQRTPSRRMFIASAAGIISIIPVASMAAAPAAAEPAPPLAAPAAGPVGTAKPAGYTLLGPEEAAFVEAVVNVMCPADSLTPNGTDCGIATYIDRQLSGDFGKGGRMYSHGPWHPGKPQQGYQLPLKPAEFFKAGIAAARAAAQTRYGKAFEQLPASDADAFLADIAGDKVRDAGISLADWFAQVLEPLFQQGCFADPVYGGNRDKVFWKMLGYPGLPAFHAQNMIQYRGKPFPSAQQPQSIQDFS